MALRSKGRSRYLDLSPCLRLARSCRIPVRFGRSVAMLAVAVLSLAYFARSGGEVSAFGVGVEGFHFAIPSLDARDGESLDLEVRGLHEASAQGFSFAARYPADSLEIERIHIEDTILEAIDIDFFRADVDPVAGTIIVGALIDVTPPFDGELIPNIGCPMTFFHVEARVAEGVSGELVIETADDLSVPPIYNGYSVGDAFELISEPARGVIRVTRPELAAFLRGDANSDRSVNMSDSIAVLEYSFLGGRIPDCMDAADVNDDELVGLSDAVYLLSYLFQGGITPPVPFGNLGPDPDGLTLDCAVPIEWLAD